LRANPKQLARLEEWVEREITALVGEEHQLLVFTYVMSLVQRFGRLPLLHDEPSLA
jgi:hypothetical protein